MINYNEILNNNMKNVLIDILKNIEKNGLKDGNHLYITFQSNHRYVVMPKWLLKKYPEEITIVIQHEYYNFSVDNKNFKISLSFNNLKADLIIDYNSIISFADPNSNFGIKLQNNKTKNLNKKNILKKQKVKKQNPNNVIDFRNYKNN